ncbi:MAG TPA: SAM-dependent methyltransferase [Thermoanaerobaculia bacterium]|nr:SAM-dependent methyltransferase [Thermoanaerobaculia bacterium]
MSLSERLRARIAKEGPISFRDFMTAALYDPQEGYYARGAPIGERGDFVTSPYVSPAFAAAIARRFADDAEKIEGPIDFVEVGAGEGEFLEGFARALARDAAALARRVRLTAVERSPAARQSLLSRKILPNARLLESVEELPERSVKGWIFSNELYDALPIVRVVGSDRGLEEMRVGVDGDRFIWTRAPAPDAYREHLANFRVALESGQVGEISFAAAPLHRRLARVLERGRLVTFDYGHTASVLYHPQARRNGTLAVHFAGFRRGDPLSRPGEVDLTAHVNWDDLVRAGESEGLASQPVARQGRYLAEAGLFDFVSNDKEKWRAYRLVDPEGMGDELSVLIQSRGM